MSEGGGLLAACYYWLLVFVGCCCQSAACLQVSPAAEGRVAVSLQTASSQPEGSNSAKRNLTPPECSCRKLVFMGKGRRGCKLMEMNGMGKGKKHCCCFGSKQTWSFLSRSHATTSVGTAVCAAVLSQAAHSSPYQQLLGFSPSISCSCSIQFVQASP